MKSKYDYMLDVIIACNEYWVSYGNSTIFNKAYTEAEKHLTKYELSFVRNLSNSDKILLAAECRKRGSSEFIQTYMLLK